MRFKKVTANKYIGDNGFSLINIGKSFVIFKDNKLAQWGKECSSIKCAERLINSHNYIKASADILPISDDDLDFISEMYGIDTSVNAVAKINSNYKIKISDSGDNTYQCQIIKGSSKIARCSDIESLLITLDKITANDNFNSIIYRGIEFRSILAAKKDKGSSRDFRQNLVRVKSSNVWAYGSEMKTNRVGDVYVQFKGKNGGPGDVYKYYDVPVTLWRKFISATSKGHFVWKYLRNNFMYSKLTGDKRGKLKNALN